MAECSVDIPMLYEVYPGNTQSLTQNSLDDELGRATTDRRRVKFANFPSISQKQKDGHLRIVREGTIKEPRQNIIFC